MISFLDLTHINRPYESALQAAAARVLSSGWYVLGQEVTQFERAFADYCGVRHCIGVANGQEALTLVLKAWELPAQSEVILPANAYMASVLAVVQAGLVPVLVEPDPVTMNLDPTRLSDALTDRTQVILPLHLYGRCANMTAINAFAEQHSLFVLEDAAQAHGATQNGQRAGNLGHAAGFSFYPTKNLGALGDGGAITTNDDTLAHHLRAWRNYGAPRKHQHQFPGHNSRLDELQAALLSVKLRGLETDNARRRQLAQFYLTHIQHPSITLPPADAVEADAWHLFVIRHADRDRLRRWLLAQEVATDVHYPVPPHLQAALPMLHGLSLPIAEQLHRDVISLPLHPALTDAQAQQIVAAINSFLD